MVFQYMEATALTPRLSAVLVALTTLSACAFAEMPAHAQLSGRPIKLIVPYAAGGLPDTVARVVGRRLQERLGQTVVIENRPGANGGIAINALISSPADGQTLAVTDAAILSINPQIYSKLAYDPKSVAPVAFLAQAPLFLAIHQKVPVVTIKEFVDYVRSRPAQLNYGSSGVGSIHHISMEGFKSELRLNMPHVPFKGTGESVPALLGGHVDVLFSAYPSLSGAAGTKIIRLLATNGADRSSQAPDVPAISEIIPGFNFASNVGIFARAGTSAAIMQKISTEAIAIVKEPEVIKQLAVVGVEPKGGGPNEFDRAIKGETERVAKVVKMAGIKLD
jgi:tripartite-type tricarboxylate transporter receptor subunit TctC